MVRKWTITRQGSSESPFEGRLYSEHISMSSTVRVTAKLIGNTISLVGRRWVVDGFAGLEGDKCLLLILETKLYTRLSIWRREGRWSRIPRNFILTLSSFAVCGNNNQNEGVQLRGLEERSFDWSWIGQTITSRRKIFGDDWSTNRSRIAKTEVARGELLNARGELTTEYWLGRRF